jgi:hypothetical protein
MRNKNASSAFSDSKHLLRPILDGATGGSGGPQFELRNLVDFSEKLLTNIPVRVDRVRPLVRNPGILMVTDREIYFQVIPPSTSPLFLVSTLSHIRYHHHYY